jgi:hypothetical protein
MRLGIMAGGRAASRSNAIQTSPSTLCTDDRLPGTVGGLGIEAELEARGYGMRAGEDENSADRRCPRHTVRWGASDEGEKKKGGDEAHCRAGGRVRTRRPRRGSEEDERRRKKRREGGGRGEKAEEEERRRERNEVMGREQTESRKRVSETAIYIYIYIYIYI